MFHGVINIYKEPGFTSHDVVAKLRGILDRKRSVIRVRSIRQRRAYSLYVWGRAIRQVFPASLCLPIIQ